MDRLRQRADFLAVANGARANSAAFVVQARARDDSGPVRVGFTVTKKNGTATERNRIRRRLRELVKRLDVISMRPHSDYVLVGRRAALRALVATQHGRSLPIQFCALGRGEKFLVRKLGRALQGRVGFVSPNAL